MQLLVTFQVTDDLNNAVKMKVSRFPCKLPCNIMGQLYSNGHLRPLPLRAHPRLLLSVSLHPSFSSGFPASCPRPWRRHHLARGRGDLIHPQRMYNEGHDSSEQCLKCCKLNVREINRKSCERFIFKGINFLFLLLLHGDGARCKSKTRLARKRNFAFV